MKTTENRITYTDRDIVVVESVNNTFGKTYWVFTHKTAGAVTFDDFDKVKRYLAAL